MGRKEKTCIENRMYSISRDFPLMALTGEDWLRVYENQGLHFHYYLEIGYCFEGEGTLHFEDASYDYHTDTITFIPKNILHGTVSRDRSLNRWEYLFVDVEKLLPFFQFQERYLQTEICEKLGARMHLFSASEHPKLAACVRQALCDMESPKGIYKLNVMSQVLTILFTVYDLVAEEEDLYAAGGSSDISIMPALDYIHDHFQQPVSVKELAELCHFSESHFRKIFVEMKEMGPAEYLSRIRIRKACQYLQNTEEPIALIAEKCGFLNITTFNRNFKKLMGQLPQQWRKEKCLYRKKTRKEYEIRELEGW